MGLVELFNETKEKLESMQTKLETLCENGDIEVEDNSISSMTNKVVDILTNGGGELAPENIADGVKIFGVTGTKKGLSLSVTANIDSGTVTATNGIDTVSGSFMNGSATLNLTGDGTWTVSGTSGERISDETTGTIKATDNVELFFFEATVGCYIMGGIETTVTCTNGETTYTSTGTDLQTFTVYERGSWTVNCEINGTVWTRVFDVQEHGKQYIEFFNGEPDPVLNNNSWQLISMIASTGRGADYWSIGDTKEVILSGTVGITTYDNVSLWAQIIGFNHNPTHEGGCSIHFQLGTTSQNNGTQVSLTDSKYNNQIYSSDYFNMNGVASNEGGWEKSKMRTTTLPALEAIMPVDLTEAIKEITKYTDNVGNGTGNIETNITATTDRLFLLSYYEVFGDVASNMTNSYENGLTIQYDYYSAGNSRVRYRHSNISSSCYWWLRSPYYNNSTSFTLITTSGGSVWNGYRAAYSLGCTPCFAL